MFCRSIAPVWEEYPCRTNTQMSAILPSGKYNSNFYTWFFWQKQLSPLTVTTDIQLITSVACLAYSSMKATRNQPAKMPKKILILNFINILRSIEKTSKREWKLNDSLRTWKKVFSLGPKYITLSLHVASGCKDNFNIYHVMSFVMFLRYLTIPSTSFKLKLKFILRKWVLLKYLHFCEVHTVTHKCRKNVRKFTWYSGQTKIWIW